MSSLTNGVKSDVPRVTVITATYNWSSVLPYSIGSVLRQTFQDFEMLVVGDGCTDDSGAVVEGIGDPRVRWINLPENNGEQSAPNNEGLRQARGEYIAYIGHDDLWQPQHLENMVAALDGGADFANSLVVRVNPPGVTPWVFMLEPWAMPPSSVMHRRSMTEKLGGWRHYRELTQTPDNDLWSRAQAAGYKFVSVPRLTVWKFSALRRKDVYREKPCHEQAAWTLRMQNEPDLEARVLGEVLYAHRAEHDPRFGPQVRRLARMLPQEFKTRLQKLNPVKPRKGAKIDGYRKHKGLEPKA